MRFPAHTKSGFSDCDARVDDDGDVRGSNLRNGVVRRLDGERVTSHRSRSACDGRSATESLGKGEAGRKITTDEGPSGDAGIRRELQVVRNIRVRGGRRDWL